MQDEPRRRRRRRRELNTSTRWYTARFNFFRRWVSDDISQFMARYIPLRSRRARQIVSAMRRRVRQYMRDNRELLVRLAASVEDERQFAIDIVTSEVLRDLTFGLEDDPILRALISP